MSDPNLPLLERAASKLVPLLDEVVFVGGVALGLLINDAAAAPIRGTNDVDVIAEIITYVDYIAFSERLRHEHFKEDSGEQPLTCRWHYEELTLDVLPLSEDVLGYTNMWHEGSLRNARTIALPSGKLIKVVSAPFFLGTKMEAFRGRGNKDFLASHDLEDFVAVVDGRHHIVQEISDSPSELQQYLIHAATELLNAPLFLDVLPGYVLDEGRVPLIIERLTAISTLNS
ncbi:MAG TPA: hypothetical protein VMU48_12085 [Terracidiphilus sp.]|nr:hypothetical protein [Terracidiphilus sp.]